MFKIAGPFKWHAYGTIAKSKICNQSVIIPIRSPSTALPSWTTTTNRFFAATSEPNSRLKSMIDRSRVHDGISNLLFSLHSFLNRTD